MVRALVTVGFGLLLGGCAGKSLSSGDGSGGYIEAGGIGSVAPNGAGGRAEVGAGGSAEVGAGGSAEAGAGGGIGIVNSGDPCTPENATATNGCADCKCSQGTWVCGHKTCSTIGDACGGRLGNTCSSTDYCAYMLGQACGRADASATCAPRPQTCPDIYAPVCGCDGAGYSNACVAAAAGTGIMNTGVCE
ncbi:MAG: Kazal-type serine protease inhibitor domain-containing protein [Polyangiaceae bacterium]